MNSIYTKEMKAEKIRTRLETNIDTLVDYLSSGSKVTIVPSRTAIKIFVGRETRLDLDKKRVGGVVNE